MPGIGELAFDIAYGGNFYAILEPQKNFAGLETMSAGDVLRLSPDRAPAAEREDPARASGESDHHAASAT